MIRVVFVVVVGGVFGLVMCFFVVSWVVGNWLWYFYLGIFVVNVLPCLFGELKLMVVL